MLIDAEEHQGDWCKNVVFDVCICGAGPAGITLARALASRGRRVALLEAGGNDIGAQSQVLYEGESVGLPYIPLDTSRLRYLGGTSNHWEGYTRPLDARDFVPLPHHPLQAWPIRQADLDPYAEQTAEILDLPQTPDLMPDLLGGKDELLVPAFDRVSTPPTQFGGKYKDELAASELVALCLHANLVDIELAPGAQSVSHLIVRSYQRDEPFEVRARYFVLCCGGMENARILLNANRQVSAGIGNQHDLVGRYFCEHPEVRLGYAVLAAPGVEHADLIAADRLLLDRRCLSFRVGLEPVQWTHDKGAVCTPATFWQRLARAFRGGSAECFDMVAVGVIMQALNYDSRVKLSDQPDRFGLRRIALEWRLSELDLHTIRTAALEMGRAMAQHGVGRMQLIEWLRDRPAPPPNGAIEEGCHHMCTTRMSDDPKLGVVDKNCRVHGIENLFIGGSSVFASGGVSNPTYTIVQLALRLGDYLQTRLA
jgi:choline dehydrogenase-like flavoprotein